MRTDARVHEFQAAQDSQRPILIKFSDGREYEFPADLNAGDWLSFLVQHGESLNSGIMSVDVVNDLFGMLLGEDRLSVIAKDTTLGELAQMGKVLFEEYMGVLYSMVQEEEPAEDAEGKVTASA